MAWGVTVWFLAMGWGARERQKETVSELREWKKEELSEMKELREEVRQLRAEAMRRGDTRAAPAPPRDPNDGGLNPVPTPKLPP